jgi:hypothetical protein
VRRWLVASLLVASCADPVQDAAVDALGPETPGVPVGPLHRPGQPCLTCHGGEGPAESTFSFAGTVFTKPEGEVPVPRALVQIVGSDQRGETLETNCAGNFFVRESRFTATFPASVVVTGGTSLPMRSLLRGTGSCNDCHGAPPGRDSPGFVWIAPRAGGAPCAGRE